MLSSYCNKIHGLTWFSSSHRKKHNTGWRKQEDLSYSPCKIDKQSICGILRTDVKRLQILQNVYDIIGMSRLSILYIFKIGAFVFHVQILKRAVFPTLSSALLKY